MSRVTREFLSPKERPPGQLNKIIKTGGTMNSTEFKIHSSSKIYGASVIGKDTAIMENVILGYPEHKILMEILKQNVEIEDFDFPGCSIGSNSIVRDGHVKIGSNVSIQGNVYIPTNVVIEDNVFIGPCAVLANDKYPIRKKYELKGPVLRKGASIGANATLLPDVEIGEGAMVAGGALVTKSVPAWKLAIGVPAKIQELPKDLKELNRI
jgi:acetyltransferase-like isoleucine patch superfamily enzyme